MPLTHFCIVRKNLPIGMIGAGLIHAAGESCGVPEHTNAVCLGVKSEDHLLKIEQALKDLGIEHFAIREPDDPWNNAILSIGIPPIEDRETIAAVTKKLQLLR